VSDLPVNRANVKSHSQPILYLNLRPFFLLGLGMILLASPFMRGLFFQPELLMFQMITAVTFAFCIYDQVLRREVTTDHLPWSLMDMAFLALILSYALSLTTAVHMRAAIGELLKVIACFMVYWMASRAVRTEKSLRYLLVVVYTAGVGVAVIGLLAATGIFNFPGAYEKGIIMSTLQYKNALAIYLAAMNVIGLGLSVKSERIIPKVLYAMGNLLLVVVILGTQSRGGWILYPLAMAGFIAMIPRQYLWRAGYHLVIFLGCGLVTARVFYDHLPDTQGVTLAIYLLYGIAAVIAGQVLYHFAGIWLNRDSVPDRTRRWAAVGGLAYLAVVLLVYLAYASSAFPVFVAEFVPGQVITRSQAISRVEPSFVQRMEMDQDALRIVQDYPLTGAGGGGWNALYHSYARKLYWSSETHNNFLQTWVEAGTVGFLALAGLWIGLVTTLIKSRKHKKEQWEVELWSAAVPALAIGVHSAFDFDLSLPAISLLLFALFGGIRGAVRETTPAETAKGDHGVPVERITRRMILVALAGTLAVLVLFYPTARFYQAGTAGAEGAKAVTPDTLFQARQHYEKAIRLDPYTASYKGDLAQIWAAEAITSKYYLARTNAIKYAEEAADAEPYNIQVRGTLINVYGLLQEYERMEREASALVEANPFIIAHYEVLARARLEAGVHYANQGDLKQARTYMQKVLHMPSELPEAVGEPTPALYLSAGQAAYYLGRYTQARDFLDLASQGSNKELKVEATVWLAATCERLGDSVQARDLLNRTRSERPRVAEAYQKLLALPILK